MEIGNLLNVLQRIQGCTFASIDSTTTPKKGVIRVMTGERVILFTNKRGSGYENMVRRRLEEAGKDPSTFVVGDLPWGQRVPDSPLITHNGNYYLQSVQLAPGEAKYYLVGIDKEVDPAHLNLPKGWDRSGLPYDSRVIVQTYKVENIDRIAVMGDVLITQLPEALVAC